MIDHRRAQELADLAEATAEELEKRAKNLLEQCRKLRFEAGQLTTLAEDARPVDRTVTRTGNIVDEAGAIRKARELGAFTRADFADALELTRPQVAKWVSRLIKHRPPVIARQEDGSYRYLEPPRGTTHRPRQAPPEVELVDPDIEVSRGEAVRVPAVQRQARNLSKSGRGHRIKQKDAQWERAQAAKQKRQAGRRRNGQPTR